MPRVTVEVAGETATVEYGGRESLVAGWGTFPDESNTGPLPGITLRDVGADGATSTNFVAQYDGQIIENLRVWGSIDQNNKKDVLVRNCEAKGTLARGTDTAAIILRSDDGKGLRVENTRLIQRSDRHNEWCSAIRGGNYSLRCVEISGFPDGLALTSRLGNVRGEILWIHDGWFNEWDEATGVAPKGNNTFPYAGAFYTHADAIQTHRGMGYYFTGVRLGGRRSPGVLNHHTAQKDLINAGDDMFNAALMLKQEVSNLPIDKLGDFWVRESWVDGGKATINLTSGNGNDLSGIHLIDIKMGRTGELAIYRPKDATGAWMGDFQNIIYADTGQPVPFTRGA